MTINQFGLTSQGDNPRIFPNGQPPCAITNGKNELCRPSMTIKQAIFFFRTGYHTTTTTKKQRSGLNNLKNFKENLSFCTISFMT